MAHTRAIDWTDPADTDIVNGGALEIRDLKEDIQERMELDHYWAVETNTSVAGADGYHKKLTMKPWEWTAAAGDGPMLYTKDIDGTIELFYYDEAGNDVQITTDGKVPVYDNLTQTAVYAEGSAYIYGIINFTEPYDAGNDFTDGVYTAPAEGFYLIGVYNEPVYTNRYNQYIGSQILVNGIVTEEFGLNGKLHWTPETIYNETILHLAATSRLEFRGIGIFKISISRLLS